MRTRTWAQVQLDVRRRRRARRQMQLELADLDALLLAGHTRLCAVHLREHGCRCREGLDATA